MFRIPILILFLCLTGCSSNFFNFGNYSCKKDFNNQNNSITYNLYYDSHHFLTLVDEKGTFNFRPHPGVDKNGWGSSWYAQPFLSDAVLAHTKIDSVNSRLNGILVNGSGKVSYGNNSTFGTWKMRIQFSYDPKQKTINGKGQYLIQLDGPLNNKPQELNLYKLASNYMVNVPLLTNKKGNTGDMEFALVNGTDFSFNWYPALQPSYYKYKSPDTSDLSVEVVGAHNIVDTKAQGDEPIAAAYKPTVTVRLTSKDPETAIVFTAFYNTKLNESPYADNIGITPIINPRSNVTTFNFDVEFSSKANSGDGTKSNL